MLSRNAFFVAALSACSTVWPAPAQEVPASSPASTSAPASQPAAAGAETFAGLKFRGIGPAFSGGRIIDIAVSPASSAEWYVAAASGGVWKTTNAGATFSPIFDSQGSYSIGCLAIDPRNPFIVWVGTGENNSQRSVGFGDGVYRSRDAGATWENLGLKDSEHIGRIVIDPRNSDVVYVAAQGPLWRSGADRGLYKTTNGGATWTRVLHISDDTGVSDVALDPRDPEVVYATAYQRRRHVWTLINGGPEGAIYKSTDGGASWRKVNRGLPEGDLGRIGLSISPVQPDFVYAIVEAAEGKGGFFRSMNRGESWEKRSDFQPSSPMYYQEIFASPHDVDHVIAVDTFLAESLDGGKTFRRVKLTATHVDFHAIWFDPKEPQHWLAGCDGGLYETWDRAENWVFRPSLPITQFYRVCVDNAAPFYFIYGGTQDNNTVGGPSRTLDRMGIANEHWFTTVGGDGFETQVDPVDPNIVYSQSQHGGLIRFDRRSSEELDIKPHEAPGEEPLRWNWDSPLLISPHNHKRLYFAANKVFRSENQGDSWECISPDLTRQIDRNALPVMGKVWGVDAIAKSASTSFFGNLVALSESPLVQGLIYVGADDGLVQVTENGGQTWRKIETFPGVPDQTYVSCLRAGQHDPDRVYAAFSNHKNGDFKAYLLVSSDRGRTWKPIAAGLPDRQIVWTIAEDHVNPKLLFVGTEFGVYFTTDAGEKWTKLGGGLPTICVKDIDIQERENDLVLGTFGRGFYVLDDYTPLRLATPELLEQPAYVFPIKDALHYVQAGRLGGRDGRGSQGASFYAAPNPPYGATVTYYLKDKLTTRKERRKEAEKKAAKDNLTPPYPTFDQLREEDQEAEPRILLVVRNEAGEVVQRLTGPREKGMHRVAWNLRYSSTSPTRLGGGGERAPWERDPEGMLASPGNYTVGLFKEVDGEVTQLVDPVPFKVVPLELATFAARDRDARLAFTKKVSRLQRAAEGASRALDEASNRIAHLRKAIIDAPSADPALLRDCQAIEKSLKDQSILLRGDSTRSRRNEPAPISILERIGAMVESNWYTTQPPTQSQQVEYRQAGGDFAKVLDALRRAIEQDLPALEKRVEAAGAPWTPGRLPTWTME
ncbi:MAG: glycosyl hydrolase [Planctomycetes bacterium]|nr:glycosyl hydrolase [Planctomycetota bacterium]